MHKNSNKFEAAQASAVVLVAPGKKYVPDFHMLQCPEELSTWIAHAAEASGPFLPPSKQHLSRTIRQSRGCTRVAKFWKVPLPVRMVRDASSSARELCSLYTWRSHGAPRAAGSARCDLHRSCRASMPLKMGGWSLGLLHPHLPKIQFTTLRLSPKMSKRKILPDGGRTSLHKTGFGGSTARAALATDLAACAAAEPLRRARRSFTPPRPT